jgi:hypothetical protein
MTASILTQDELKRQLHYDPTTGIFTRNIIKTGRFKVGQEAGCFDSSNGYLKIGLNGKRYFSHRLAWLYVNGYFPDYIDHINGNRTDNRFVNLREASASQNAMNRGLPSNNTTGVIGVRKHRNKFTAVVKINKKNKYIGIYKTKEEAAKAATNERKLLFGEFFKE